MDKREFLKGSVAAVSAMVLPRFAGGMDMASSDVPRVNWSGNYHYHTDKVFQPATVAEVQDAVRTRRSPRSPRWG